MDINDGNNKDTETHYIVYVTQAFKGYIKIMPLKTNYSQSHKKTTENLEVNMEWKKADKLF